MTSDTWRLQRYYRRWALRFALAALLCMLAAIYVGATLGSAVVIVAGYICIMLSVRFNRHAKRLQS